MSVPRLFISPSDQPANVGALDIHEQHYAQIRARRLEAAIHKYAAGRVTTRISQEGIGDSASGYATSVREGNRWGHDDYHAEHSNATGSAVKASGVHVYIWPSDPRAYRWAQAIIARIGHYFGGKPAIRDGSHLMEVNSSHGTAVLNETGFHDNPADARVIMSRSDEIGTQLGLAYLDYRGIKHNGGAPRTTPPATSSALGGIMATVAEIWFYPVRRGGKRIPAIQELADIKTMLLNFWRTPVHRGDKHIPVIQEIADCKTLALDNQQRLDRIERMLVELLKADSQDDAISSVTAITRTAAAIPAATVDVPAELEPDADTTIEGDL